MSDPGQQSNWVARTFTRARVMGVHLARIPFGDKSLELPVVLNRTQLLAAAIGTLVALPAFGIGSVIGHPGWTTWPVVALTVLAVVALGFSSAPDRGAGLFVEGYARLAWSRLVRSSAVSSSRSRPPRRGGQQSYAVTMTMHAPARSGSEARS